METSKSRLKISVYKMHLIMANNCLNPYDICGKSGISYQAYQRIIKTGNCKIGTLGKIAKALNVDVTEILEDWEVRKWRN